MTVVSTDLVELHRRIALLEALANHLRYCNVCHEKDVPNCELGKRLWLSTGHDLVGKRLAHTEQQPETVKAEYGK